MMLKFTTFWGLLMISFFGVFAADFTVNGLNYQILNANSVAIVALDEGSYTGLTSGNFSESVTYNGQEYAVIAVGEQAFNKASFSGMVTLPASITTIGQFAFYRATGDGVTLGANVSAMASNAFAGNKFSRGMMVDASNVTFANLTDSDGTNSSGALVTKDKKTLISFPGGKTQSGWGGTTALSSYTIPSFITEVGDFAFYRNEGLVTINIPNTVTRIGRAAFLECLDYANITIPESVTELGEAAFQGCVNATRLTFNTTQLENIPSNAFFCCVSLKSITLPEGVKYLGNSAFASCEQLSSFTLSSTVETIDQSCFMGDPITSINLKNVKNIAYMAFGRCESLTSITGGSQLEFIDNAAFVRCDALTTLSFPEGVKTFFGNTFFRCASLKNLTLPASVQCIGVNPVTGCEQLSNLQVAVSSPYFKIIDGALYATTGSTVVGTAPNTGGDPDQPTVLVSVPSAIAKKALTVPEGVTTLGTQSAREVELTRVDLPSTLTSIRDFAFGDVYTLNKVVCRAANAPDGGIIENENYIFEDEVFQNATLYVPATSIDTYRSHVCWGRFNNILPLDSLETTVDPSTEGKFPYLVENDYTFYFQIINDSEVQFIAPSDYDPDLQPYSGQFQWDAPETVEYNGKTYTVAGVGEGAFRNATMYGGNQYTHMFWFPSTIRYYAADAFNGWNSNMIGMYGSTIDPTALRNNKINRFRCFVDGYDITEDNDHGNYNGKDMGGDIYHNVDGKRVLVAFGGDHRVNAWVKHITGAAANRNITTEWTFNYDEIGDYALSGNDKLQTVTIEGATKIGQEALAGMTALHTLVLPSTLTEIGTDAFKGVTTLTSLTVNAVIPPSGGVFEDAVYETLKDRLVVPAGSEEAYKAAPGWKRFYSDAAPDLLRGDLNGDGNVDVSDVSLLIDVVLGKDFTLAEDAVVDLDGDGNVDVSDVSLLIDIVLGKID